MPNGHCVVCETEGMRRRNFICGECGDPNAIILYCVSCKTRRHARPEVLDMLQTHLAAPLPQRMGITLKNSCCANCAEPNEEVRTEIFLLHHHHLH